MQPLKFDKFDFDWRSLSLEDKVHNLKNAFFKVKTKKNPKWHWDEVTELSYKFISFGEGFNQEAMEEVEIDFSFPETGFYNFKGTAIYFSRLFTRQWKRGISKGNASFDNFLSEFWKVLPKELVASHDFLLSAENLNTLFGRKEISFSQACKQIQEGKALAKAISRHVLVSCGINGELPLLWFRGCPVAEVSDKKVVIKAKIFEQELRDLLRNENLEISL